MKTAKKVYAWAMVAISVFVWLGVYYKAYTKAVDAIMSTKLGDVFWMILVAPITWIWKLTGVTKILGVKDEEK